MTGGERPTVTAHNVAAFMARAAELEPQALAAIERLVTDGALPAAEDPGAGTGAGLAWVTEQPRGVARQAVQWAVDHPDHGLQDEAFRVARHVLE